MRSADALFATTGHAPGSGIRDSERDSVEMNQRMRQSAASTRSAVPQGPSKRGGAHQPLAHQCEPRGACIRQGSRTDPLVDLPLRRAARAAIAKG